MAEDYVPGYGAKGQETRGEYLLLGWAWFPRRRSAEYGLERAGTDPVVTVPRQRQSISAASVVNSAGGFGFATYTGALSGVLLVTLLKQMMRGRRKPRHLVVDGLPAHKTKVVREYVDRLKGKLTLHFLLGYAPDLNSDGLVWTYAKRMAQARRPLHTGEMPAARVGAQFLEIVKNRKLLRSSFWHPSVANISDE